MGYLKILSFASIYFIRLTGSLNISSASGEPEQVLKQCVPNDAQGCSCKFSDNSGVVDLRSLGNTDRTPLFKDVKGSDGNMYSYNPCHPFTEGKCSDAAVCLSQEGEAIQIGDAGRTMYQYSPETSEVTAAYVTRKSILSVSEVTLVCDPHACNPQFVFEGTPSIGLYKFQLTSVCSCVGLCNENGPVSSCDSHGSSSSSGWLGPGTYILIGIVALALVYLVSGVMYMKVKKQASGKDLIPKKALWVQLGTLIMDGITFTFSKCLPRRAQYETTN